MSLTVREALTLNVLRNARVVAGERGLDNPIRWTHIIDLPDVSDWVKGGEVLLTSGLGIHADAEAQVKYMREAAAKRVAAVFVAVQEYLPHTTPIMRAIADEAGIPLVELPRTTAFVEITEAILRRLATRSMDAERDYLIDALLAGNLPESEETLARLRALGLEPDLPHALLLAQPAGAGFEQPVDERAGRAILAALNRLPRRGVMALMPSYTLAIFPLSAREQSSVPFAHAAAEALAGEAMRVGAGRLVRQIADFPVSYREAREALFVAAITGEAVVRHFNDLGVWRLLLRVEDETELQRFVDYYLNPVAAHDREQGTDWLTTLETFLQQKGNLRATARALMLHRNTVGYQIERISQLLGKSLDDPEVRLNLQLALRARTLLRARARRD